MVEPWSGPFKVVSSNRRGNVLVLDIGNDRLETVNIRRFKKAIGGGECQSQTTHKI